MISVLDFSRKILLQSGVVVQRVGEEEDCGHAKRERRKTAQIEICSCGI